MTQEHNCLILIYRKNTNYYLEVYLEYILLQNNGNLFNLSILKLRIQRQYERDYNLLFLFVKLFYMKLPR